MQRLQSRPQFQAVLAGATVARTPHFALHRCALEAPAGSAPPLFGVQAPWLGAMVPKRWAKRAVTRNAIKRQIYALSREPGYRFPVAAHVVRLRAAFDRKVFASASSQPLKAAVRAELQQLFARATTSATAATIAPAPAVPVRAGA